jgi:hypothetical protein
MSENQMTAKSIEKFTTELDVQIRARYPFVAINTYEEDRVREALINIAGTIKGILGISEFEKAVSGMKSSNKTDDGETARTISYLLNWMQDNKEFKPRHSSLEHSSASINTQAIKAWSQSYIFGITNFLPNGAGKMSKYMSFESEAFANRKLPVAALKEMGFEKIEGGTDLLLDGWDKRDRRTADVVIRKRDVPNHWLLSDIGFQKTKASRVAVLDDMDLDYRLGRDFVRRLQTGYHEQTVVKMAKKLGGTLIKERVASTIKIRVKY